MSRAFAPNSSNAQRGRRVIGRFAEVSDKNGISQRLLNRAAAAVSAVRIERRSGQLRDNGHMPLLSVSLRDRRRARAGGGANYGCIGDGRCRPHPPHPSWRAERACRRTAQTRRSLPGTFPFPDRRARNETPRGWALTRYSGYPSLAYFCDCRGISRASSRTNDGTYG